MFGVLELTDEEEGGSLGVVVGGGLGETDKGGRERVQTVEHPMRVVELDRGDETKKCVRKSFVKGPFMDREEVRGPRQAEWVHFEATLNAGHGDIRRFDIFLPFG